ncbi:MAG: hypothetical protein Q9222_002439 [Ikaeria aurantiellina]
MAAPGIVQDSTDELSAASLRSRASSIVTTTTKFSLETLSQDDRSSIGGGWERQLQGNADRTPSLLSLTSIARPAPPYSEVGNTTLQLPDHQDGHFHLQPNGPREISQYPTEAISISEALPPSPTHSIATTASPGSPADIEANPQSQTAYYSNVVRTLDHNYTASIEALRQQHAQQLAMTRHDIDQAYRAQWKAKNREIEKIREEAAMAKDLEVSRLRTEYESKFHKLEDQVKELERQAVSREYEAVKAEWQAEEKKEISVERARHEVEDLWEKRWNDRTRVENDERQVSKLQKELCINNAVQRREDCWLRCIEDKDPALASSITHERTHGVLSRWNWVRKKCEVCHGYHDLSRLRNLLFILFLLRWTRKSILQLRGRGPLGTIADAYIFLRRYSYSIFLRLPGVRSKVQNQVSEAIAKIEGQLVPSGPGTSRYLTLPKEGWTEHQVRAELGKLEEMKHTRWEDGRVSGAVYHGGNELIKVQSEAFERFMVANPIHPDVFPGVRKMEAEIVAMVLALFNAPPGAAGVTSSGGTESILMACMSARQKAYTERGVTEPEMIIPETSHAAFHKAASYFKIKLHVVACPPPTFGVSIRAVSRLINSNTILLVGSAPNFPHGIIDDIAALSRLALKRRLPLHVDCCLGSFLMPFLQRAGFPSEPFDFSLGGVTSISCDTHKYGFAPKGNSTLLYRTAALRTYQYFILPDWSGGVYGSIGIAGSRPGALIASCWASLMSVGESGYIDSCHSIVGTAKKIEAAIREDPVLKNDLKIIGKPLVSVVAFTSPTLNIYDVADSMSAKGWHLNSLQNPPAMHVAVTMPIVKVVDKFLEDLVAVVEEEKERERVRVAEGKGKKGQARGDSAALYGVAGSLPDKSVVVQLAGGFLDTLYKA